MSWCTNWWGTLRENNYVNYTFQTVNFALLSWMATTPTAMAALAALRSGAGASGDEEVRSGDGGATVPGAGGRRGSGKACRGGGRDHRL